MGDELKSKPSGQAGKAQETGSVQKGKELILERFGSAADLKLENIRETDDQRYDRMKGSLLEEVDRIFSALEEVKKDQKLVTGESLNPGVVEIQDICNRIFSITPQLREYEKEQVLIDKLAAEVNDYTTARDKYENAEKREKEATTDAQRAALRDEKDNNSMKMKSAERRIKDLRGERDRNTGALTEDQIKLIKNDKLGSVSAIIDNCMTNPEMTEGKTDIKLDSRITPEALGIIGREISNAKGSAHVDVDKIEICAREAMRICNGISMRYRIEEGKKEAKKREQERREMEMRLALENSHKIIEHKKREEKPKNGRKPVAESITLLGAGVAFYGLATSMPYVALGGLAASLIGFDAYKSKHSWRQAGDFCAKAIGIVGTTAGLASTVSGGLAYLIQKSDSIEMLLNAKFNGLYVIASHIVDYVNVVGEPLKLLIGGAVCTVASLTASWIIGRITDNIDE